MMREEDEIDQPWDNELSVEAQAHRINMFLSSSTSDSGIFFSQSSKTCHNYRCDLYSHNIDIVDLYSHNIVDLYVYSQVTSLFNWISDIHGRTGVMVL